MFFKSIFKIKFLYILLIGIISGMPFSILYTSTITWLKDAQIGIAIIGFFAFSRTPYAFKFVWAPFVDYFKIPILYNVLGKRRSWMIICSSLIAVILYILSKLDPAKHIHYFQILNLSMGFIAATYDIACDALRIQILEKEEQANGSAIASFAYRMGGLITGAGALYMSDIVGWPKVFFIYSILFTLGSTIIFFINVQDKELTENNLNLQQSIVEPFKDVMRKPYIFTIIGAILFYKVGDAMLSFMGMPFYKEIGFTNSEIAFVVKFFGLIASIVGTFCGAYIMNRFGFTKGLLIDGFAQMITNLGYVWLHHAGNDMNVFFVTNFSENFTGGMGGAALGAFVNRLCNKKYAGTQFALLTSIATFANHTITGFSGVIVSYIGWDAFFVFTALISLPGLALVVRLNKLKLDF